nr:hypothetical protein [Bradyrhizobium sp. WSM2793]
MLQIDHRISHDVDIFLPDPQVLPSWIHRSMTSISRSDLLTTGETAHAS